MKPVAPRASHNVFLLRGLAVLAVLVGLGTWQLQRKAWKDGLIATLTERLRPARTAARSRKMAAAFARGF